MARSSWQGGCDWQGGPETCSETPAGAQVILGQQGVGQGSRGAKGPAQRDSCRKDEQSSDHSVNCGKREATASYRAGLGSI